MHEAEVEETKQETRAKVALKFLEAIERAREAGTITTGSTGQWTPEALRERLMQTLEVDTSYVHAPGSPPRDYFGNRSQSTSTLIEHVRARCPEGEAQSRPTIYRTRVSSRRMSEPFAQRGWNARVLSPPSRTRRSGGGRPSPTRLPMTRRTQRPCKQSTAPIHRGGLMAPGITAPRFDNPTSDYLGIFGAGTIIDGRSASSWNPPGCPS